MWRKMIKMLDDENVGRNLVSSDVDKHPRNGINGAGRKQKVRQRIEKCVPPLVIPLRATIVSNQIQGLI